MNGHIIRIHRTQAGMTQENLAKFLHVTKQTVSNWELDKRIPDLSLLPDLCRILNISYSELFDGEIENYPELEKEKLLYKCISYAHVANRLCTMLDRWYSESLEIRTKENVELSRRGVNVNSLIRRMSDIDPIGLQKQFHEKSMEEFHTMYQQYGEQTMSYVCMIYFLGSDLARGVCFLPKESDPGYRDSVCCLLLTDHNDYCTHDHPYDGILQNRPELVASCIRKALSVIIKAV